MKSMDPKKAEYCPLECGALYSLLAVLIRNVQFVELLSREHAEKCQWKRFRCVP
jgi:hypothetical protein